MNGPVIARHGARPADPRPVVLFDGGCPMCRREIDHYRRVAGSEQLVWVDLAAIAPDDRPYGIRHAEALALFHVRDAHGTWHIGVAGFVELWAQLKGYRQLARLFRLLQLPAVLGRPYRWFARWRLQRRCDDGACAAGVSVGQSTPSNDS